MKSEEKIRAMKEVLEDYLKGDGGRLMDFYVSKKTKQGIPVMIRALRWVLDEKE